jgi:hypothetical protein
VTTWLGEEMTKFFSNYVVRRSSDERSFSVYVIGKGDVRKF